MRYVSLTAFLLTSACAVGPDYQRPSISIPDVFKEAASPAPAPAQPVADKATSDTVPASDAQPAKVLAEAVQSSPELAKPAEENAAVEKNASSSLSSENAAPSAADKNASDTVSASDEQPRILMAEAARPFPEIVKPAEEKAVAEENTSSSLLPKSQFSMAALTKLLDRDTLTVPPPVLSVDIPAVADPATSAPVADTSPAQSTDAPAAVASTTSAPVADTSPAQSTDAPAPVASTTSAPVADTSPAQSTDAPAVVASTISAPAADTGPAQSTDAPAVVASTTSAPVADTSPAQSADAPTTVGSTIAALVEDIKPTKDIPEAAKKLQPAQPKEDALRGQWWTVFEDQDLNALEEQVASHNQTVQASEAAFRQARALVAQYRSTYFPTISGDASESRSKAAQSSAYTVSGAVRNNYSASLGASWVPDFWGRVRRQMESGKATAEASAANLAVATLSAQTELATDYLNLRIADEQKRLLERTVAAYAKSLYISENQYKAGVAARSDVLQAKVQMESTQAQLVNIGVQRAQYEHAIAVLIGKAPAEFSLAAVDAVPALPDVPNVVPSQLMERRPDIAASERSVIAANAQIGVAEAAYFPNITLAASGGYSSSTLANWFTLPTRFWSVGPSLAETLFDGGLRSAQTEAAIASYDQTVANYRQTVLTAFQEVEDNLASLRILAQESEVLEGAVQDANASAQVSMNQYKAGTVSYLSVITTQTAALNAQLSALNVRKERLLAAATLIDNVGGGWNVAELSNPAVTQAETTPISMLPPSVGKP